MNPVTLLLDVWAVCGGLAMGAVTLGAAAAVLLAGAGYVKDRLASGDDTPSPRG